MAAYGEHDVAVVTRGVRGKLNPALPRYAVAVIRRGPSCLREIVFVVRLEVCAILCAA
jgi:hypothetical protein